MLSGNFFDYILVFGGGVLVSFSPCIFPLVPVTLAYIGVREAGARTRGLIHSLVYVLGLAITYSLLGLAAALSGKIFGQISVHPITQMVLGIIFILLGLSFFDIFNIPAFGFFAQNKIKINNLWSIFLFGMVSGLAIGPCTAPTLGAVLLYVGSRQNILRGITLLFTFAYGVGAVLILTATIGGFFLSLSKSTVWLVRIKKAGGIILMVVGAYYLFNGWRLR